MTQKIGNRPVDNRWDARLLRWILKPNVASVLATIQFVAVLVSPTKPSFFSLALLCALTLYLGAVHGSRWQAKQDSSKVSESFDSEDSKATE